MKTNTKSIEVNGNSASTTSSKRNHNHGIAVRFLYEKLGAPTRADDIELFYTRTEFMSADIYTKHFTTAKDWNHALELINIWRPEDVEDMIRRRRSVHDQMEIGYIRHPNNLRKHKASPAAARTPT